MGIATNTVTFPILCPRLEAKFVRKSITSRSMRRVQNHEITGPWRQSLSKSTDWTLTMSKSITTREIDGHFHSLALRVATDRISHAALPASSQECSRHTARGYIVNSCDVAMSFIWYAICETRPPSGQCHHGVQYSYREESWQSGSHDVEGVPQCN